MSSFNRRWDRTAEHSLLCSECDIDSYGDVHNSIDLVFGVCTLNPFNEDTFFFVTPAMNTTANYTLHINCSAGCQICQNATTYGLDVCSDSSLSPMARILLTETTCTGGLDPISLDGTVYIEYDSSSDCDSSAGAFTVFSFGNTTEGLCVPFLRDTFAMVMTESNNSYAAALYCDPLCRMCKVTGNGVAGCQTLVDSSASWLLAPISSLSSCIQPPLPPTPPSPFKLSTGARAAQAHHPSLASPGAIVGIAAGGAVTVTLAAAAVTLYCKKRRPQGFRDF